MDHSGQSSRRHLSFRSAHRARSHASAHAEPAEAGGHLPLVDPLVPQGPPTLVAAPAQLAALIDHLQSAGRFAYDSEFIGELTYVPKLCLVQVASAQQIALIDPLTGLDLRPFWELVADVAIEKVVHAGQQDLEPVVRLLDRAPANVFDTQISAGFAGLPYPLSLSKLVQEFTGVKLGKGLTFTHWDQRPLSNMQLRYAADDVRYLILLRQRLGERLEALGHTAWAAEECANQCNPKLFEFNPEHQYLRVRGASALAARNLAVLRDLTIWRDASARRADVPPRAFLKDEVLLDLARNPIKSVEKLARVKGLPRPVEAEYGPRIVELTARALSLPPAQLPLPREAEQSPTEKFRTDALWAVAQCLCWGQSIDPAVVTSRQEISDLYQRLVANDPSAEHRLLTGWRGQAVGDALRELILGGARAELSWPGGSLHSRVHRA